MPNTKTYLSDDRTPPQSQIGASLESLAHTIHERRNAGDESYTHRLLTGDIDTLLKKVAEEAHEATLAAKDVVYNEGDDAQVNHLRYGWRKGPASAVYSRRMAPRGSPAVDRAGPPVPFVR